MNAITIFEQQNLKEQKEISAFKTPILEDLKNLTGFLKPVRFIPFTNLK